VYGLKNKEVLTKLLVQINIFSASNSIRLTWDAAVDYLNDDEMLDNNSFSPLNM